MAGTLVEDLRFGVFCRPVIVTIWQLSRKLRENRQQHLETGRSRWKVWRVMSQVGAFSFVSAEISILDLKKVLKAGIDRLQPALGCPLSNTVILAVQSRLTVLQQSQKLFPNMQPLL